MITSNVFRRIFFICYGQSTGTAFTIDSEGRQYLVTARHVCPDLIAEGVISIRRNDAWEDWPVRVVGAGQPGDLGTDVIVLALSKQLSPSFSLPATSAGLVWGQDVYFLGFPYGLHTMNAPNDGYPLPLVKRALMSGAVGEKFETFLLDGHNNEGFSGGPVVFKPNGSHSAEFHVLGLVSAYKTSSIPVTFNGKPTGLSSQNNTGIVVCPAIKRATDFIAENPIGPNITF